MIPYARIKRLFDIFFSFFILIVFSPIYLGIYLLVRFNSQGPGFYSCLRMGHKGKLIRCFKFRTMVPNADRLLPALLSASPQMQKQWLLFHKLKEDPRVTRVGKFLRKTALDELPQFWNVLKGDLSVIGPRPIDVSSPESANREIRAKLGLNTDLILSVKPGIGSLWHVQGRNRLSLPERAALEAQYVRNQSIMLDIVIFWKTICILLFPKDA